MYPIEYLFIIGNKNQLIDKEKNKLLFKYMHAQNVIINVYIHS